MMFRVALPSLLGLSNLAMASNDCNWLAGTWTLTYANTTSNGTTTVPYGDMPMGFLFMTPRPDLTWIEELGAAPNTSSTYGAQSSAGYYEMSRDGQYQGRTTLASTISTNVGLSETSEVLGFKRHGNELVQTYLPIPGVTVIAIWTKWVPGTKTYPFSKKP